MEVGGHRRIGQEEKNEKFKDVLLKIHDGDRSTERKRTRPTENMENENLMCRPQIGKRSRKKGIKKFLYCPVFDILV